MGIIHIYLALRDGDVLMASQSFGGVIKRCKQLAAHRHLRIAKQYIEHVVLSEFPKKKGNKST